MTDCQSWTDADGHLHYVMQGASEAVTLEAWLDRGHPIGLLALHSPRPLRPDHRLSKCREFGEACYLAIATSEECLYLADLAFAGRDADIWLALAQWFTMTFQPQEAGTQ